MSLIQAILAQNIWTKIAGSGRKTGTDNGGQVQAELSAQPKSTLCKES